MVFLACSLDFLWSNPDEGLSNSLWCLAGFFTVCPPYFFLSSLTSSALLQPWPINTHPRISQAELFYSLNTFSHGSNDFHTFALVSCPSAWNSTSLTLVQLNSSFLAKHPKCCLLCEMLQTFPWSPHNGLFSYSSNLLKNRLDSRDSLLCLQHLCWSWYVLSALDSWLNEWVDLLIRMII